MILVLLYWFTLAASSFYVAWAGDRDEKIAISLYGAASFVTALVVSPEAERFRHLEWPVMVVDTALLVPFIWLVLRSTRHWPLWIAAFQLVSVVTNSVVLSAASRHAYATTLYLLSYAILGTIVIGSDRSRRRRMTARFEFDRRA